MKKKIMLIACAAQKLDHPTAIEKLYTSTLFQKAVCYAKAISADYIYVLSAKYGVVPLGEVKAPYNKTLKTMSSAERKVWAQACLSTLAQRHNLERDEFILLAGKAYRAYLQESLPQARVPLEGLRIGEQMQWLDRHTPGPTTASA